MMQALIEHLNKMKSHTLQNYVIAGLNSSLITNGSVRYFENSRNHQDSITPHTHRFDFVCLVLEGSVINKIWEGSPQELGDEFLMSRLTYLNQVGTHAVEHLDRAFFQCHEYCYSAGEVYSMTQYQYHSIVFSRDAKVLFFEGPTQSDESFILEPWVNGERIPTYENRPYMFKES